MHFTVGFRVRLGRIANANHLAARQPGVDLFHAINLVFLGSLRQTREQACKIPPAGIAEDKGALRIEFIDKLVEECV